jgi:hypothetical protein
MPDLSPVEERPFRAAKSSSSIAVILSESEGP